MRRDGDDPYLVVAADKGTATFSDIANAISAEYGFWLDDAFASGGSAGYDHKKMAITARGGWECVKRHFRELGIDTQKQDFTVAGIGDMAGDVFGNGMLQSPHIRLVAAFNHLHIFLDPNPDAARGFAERRRLFKLPRSSWEDYDRKLISKGGGVFARSAKSISLSSQAQALLGLRIASATPQEVIRAILKLPVDLLWNGGIGTYVKSSRESNADIGDRTNDGSARQRQRSTRKGRRRRRQPRTCRSSGASSTRYRADASIPTSSTIPPASTARTSKSTSRSCSTPKCWPASSAAARAIICWCR